MTEDAELVGVQLSLTNWFARLLLQIKLPVIII